MSDVFSAWGYAPVETPAVEELGTLERGVGGGVGEGMFRLFDVDGSLLALRPEMTVPIARLAASRLADQPGPHRVRYVAPVFREHVSLRGQARQFTQAGWSSSVSVGRLLMRKWSRWQPMRLRQRDWRGSSSGWAQ